MYEELRIRALTFEVLTRGAPAADNVEGAEEGQDAEGKEIGLELPALPPEMIRDLRVRLHVWEAAGEGNDEGAQGVGTAGRVTTEILQRGA